MTARSKELLLEVLLLSVRYTPAEIAWVKRELSLYPDANDVGELLQLFRSKTPAKKSKKAEAESADEIGKTIDAFAAQLLQARSNKERQRIFSVARRLAIPSTPGSQQEIVEKVRAKLYSMEPPAAAAVLRNYRNIGQVADKGYVGLANYLIQKPEKKD